MLLTTLVILSACDNFSQTNAPTVVVTQVIVQEGQEQIVTQIVRQTIAVTATPEPVSVAPVELVALDISFTAAPANIDPQEATSSEEIDLIENLFVGLTNFNHAQNQVEPELAKEWQVSANGRLWTFNLRDDLFWVRPAPNPPAKGQLGQVAIQRPVVADDVVYAIQRACDKSTDAPSAFVLFIIEGCEQVHSLAQATPADLRRIGARALDDLTLQISLTKPASQFLTITTLPLFYPIPREQIEALGNDWLLPENIYTSGPFVPITGGFSTSRAVLHRNPQWPLIRQGNVDIVNILYLNEEMDAFELWQARSLDLSPLPFSEQEGILKNNPQKAQLVTEQTVFYLGYNFDSGVFREAEMRRAFGAAIDREQLVEDLLGEQAQPMRHLTPPGVWAAPPIDEVGVGYSPDYATQQLAASGFRSCRLMPPITLLVSSSDQSLQQAESIRDMWVEVLGCSQDQIVIEQAQFGTLLANTRVDAGAARPDVWELGWASYYPDAHDWLGDLLHCMDSENRQNRPCSEVDDLIRQAANTTNLDDRSALYRQIENLFFGNNGIEPISPLYIPGDYILVQSWLTYTPAIFGGEQYDTYVIDAALKRLERSR